MRYYIYILLDDREKGCYDNKYFPVNLKPFYIGKGDSLSKNKYPRHLIHYRNVKNNNNDDQKSNPHKFNTIKKLQEEGFEPNFLIVYQNDDEKKVLDVEMELIKFYGKFKNEGILTNISDGRKGGNIFPYVDGLREKLDKIASERWSGKNNPNYGKPKEETYSYRFKDENGYHWNSGRKRKMTEEQKEIQNRIRYEKLSIVEMVCPESLEVMDTLKSLDAIKKYNLSPSGLCRSIHKGGKCKGYYWKYVDKELVLSESKRPNYIKKEYQKKDKDLDNLKKVYYKKNISDKEEILFGNIYEASKFLGFCHISIQRKCKINNRNTHIFRYEDEEYRFNVKKGRGLRIMSIDEEGNKIIYESISEASIAIGGNPSTITQVCKGTRKRHRKLKFKYI